MYVCGLTYSHTSHVVPSPADTPPGMIGGGNAAAVAIPVVLVLLLVISVVVGVVCVGLYLYCRNKGLELRIS